MLATTTVMITGELIERNGSDLPPTTDVHGNEREANGERIPCRIRVARNSRERS